MRREEEGWDEEVGEGGGRVRGRRRKKGGMG